ncbi:MAG: 4-(cytidine 5'-diphospho)-2-C-methyl-D-erythritol kinase [Firmicutes bacterium]|nr:4-(cytidine 5'-diphospho)-2-C-methyl-D-erythritol kinase [Bacillota bacterium]
MGEISLQARAKLNLTLDIVGKRSDGYHLLESVMQSIALADHILLRKRARGITLRVDDPHIPADERNTAWRAAELFLSRLKINSGIEIAIEKNIPCEAGLGGGSADAAAVLYGLNLLFDTGLSQEDLRQLGVQIGADVPFCLVGGTQLAEGIGDELTELRHVPQAMFALVKPAAGISTKTVYQSLEPTVFGTEYSKSFIRRLATGQGWSDLALELGNVLESVTTKLLPEVNEWKIRLLDFGALGVLMSGSGPTVFGVFLDRDLAQAFHDKWQGHGQVILTHPVGRGIG